MNYELLWNDIYFGNASLICLIDGSIIYKDEYERIIFADPLNNIERPLTFKGFLRVTEDYVAEVIYE